MGELRRLSSIVRSEIWICVAQLFQLTDLSTNRSNSMNVVFGVISDDFDESRRWVEAAIGLVGRYGDHMDMGGEYFEFVTDPPKSILLLNNTDIVTGKSFTSSKNEKWRFIVAMSNNEKGGRVFSALLAVPSRFTFLGEEDV